jgi:hypothetical protein
MYKPRLIAAFRELLPPVRLPPFARGLGKKPNSRTDLSCSDSTSRGNCRPDGVIDRFQIIGHGVEPSPPNRARSLLSKKLCRAALSDEPKPLRPEMTRIFERSTLSGFAERLAGTRTCPNRSIIAPSGKSQGEGPSANPGEEVGLRVSSEIIWLHVND